MPLTFYLQYTIDVLNTLITIHYCMMSLTLYLQYTTVALNILYTIHYTDVLKTYLQYITA